MLNLPHCLNTEVRHNYHIVKKDGQLHVVFVKATDKTTVNTVLK